MRTGGGGGSGKPAGFNSQRTPYQLKGTVEYAIGVYLKKCARAEPVRIIHRLDRGTSGGRCFPRIALPRPGCRCT